jgi:2-polyprenyl-6-methoxyphenol hydroxylase-like FAD-dependent oxidoreductase
VGSPLAVHSRAPATVLISGAGIAGPTLAFWLHAAGFTPVLVESSPQLRTGGFVIDLWGLGYEIAQHMGLGDELDRVGYHVQEMRIVDDRGRRIAGFGNRVLQELTGGRFVTLARGDLSRLLFERIQAETEIILGDEIVAIRDQAEGVYVQFRDASERRFDLVVGADGLHSNVRRLVFGPQEAFETGLGYLAAAFEVAGYRPRDENLYVLYGKPRRMVGRFALRDDRTLFLFVFVDEAGRETASLDQGRKKALLLEHFASCGWEVPAILDELGRSNEVYLDRVSQIRMPQWSSGRICLVGDAAFCVSLTAGQGSALAMTGAYVLAGELARAGGRHPHAFHSYEQRLREYVRSKQRGAAHFAQSFAPRTHLGLWVRNQLMRLTAIPQLARLTIGGGVADTINLPHYPWS